MLFVPEGYRGVLQILLTVDEELTSLYASAQGEEEKQSIQNRILAENKEILDEIYGRLESGEDFRNLIPEYGNDEGMNEKTFLEDGYDVHRESVLYPKKFVEMCFGSDMIDPGDYSGAFVTEHGIHILYYLRDVPAVTVELTEDIKLMLAGELLETKVAEKYEELSDMLVEKAVVQYNT